MNLQKIGNTIVLCSTLACLCAGCGRASEGNAPEEETVSSENMENNQSTADSLEEATTAEGNKASLQDNMEADETETGGESDAADDAEADMAFEGVSAYISQNDYGETYSWYRNEEDFIEACGFAEAEPFYQYTMPDGSPRLILYYDEETKEGCGVRYYERDPSTFVFSGCYGFTLYEDNVYTEKTWEGYAIEEVTGQKMDYLAPLSVEGETRAEAAQEYQENFEYDDAGRITHFDSSGILDYLGDDDASTLLWIDYEYGENGFLKHRSYHHNYFHFTTFACSLESYFDDAGRLEYEDRYLTHGSLDTYYIYDGKNDKPSYCLQLDNNLGSWIPEFVQYAD